MILPDRQKLGHRSIVQKVRSITLLKQGLVAQSQENPPSQEGREFKRLVNTLQRSVVTNRRKTCTICEMKIQVNSLSTISSCQHVLCESCSSSYLAYKITTQEEIVCPSEGCLQPLNKSSPVYQSLPVELKRKYDNQARFHKVRKSPHLKLCTQKDCQGVVDTTADPCICLDCKTIYCENCLDAKHEGQCQLFPIECVQQSDKLRKCNRCKSTIEANYSFSQFSCRCKDRFCYFCGADWDRDLCRDLSASSADTAAPIIDVAPPPPPQILPPSQPSCCGRFWKMAAKLILVPFWAIFGLIFVMSAMICYVLFTLVIAFCGGPYEFTCNTLNKRSQCAKVLLYLLLPFIYLVGVPFYFFESCSHIWDSWRKTFIFYRDTLSAIRGW